MSSPPPIDLATERLLELAHYLAHDPEGSAREQLWEVTQELHRRPERAVFARAAEWCEAGDAIDRALGADILGQLGAPDRPWRDASLEILHALLRDPDPEVVCASLVALGHIGAPESAARIVELAGHHVDDVRRDVAFALCGFETPEAIATLVRLTADAEHSVRDWATFGLGTQTDLDTPEIRDALAARLSDPHDDTRAEALVGLARRGDTRAREPLRRALQSDVVGVLDVEAAFELGDPTLLPQLEALSEWWDLDAELLDRALARCRANVS